MLRMAAYRATSPREDLTSANDTLPTGHSMRFSTEIKDVELPGLVNEFVQIVGATTLQKKFDWIVREHSENPYMAEWLLEYHGLEATLASLIEEIQRTGLAPRGLPSREHYDLYSFIAGIVNIHRGLSARAQNRLRGMLLDGLNTDKGLASVAHEVTTAIHLIHSGFDVEFHDLEHGSGVDFIASKNEAELEVECKVFTADIGRQIHKRRLLTLYKTLMPMLQQIHRDASLGIIVRITIPGRLTPSLDQAKQIVDTTSRAVLQGQALVESEACRVQTLDFKVADSPFAVAHPSQLSRQNVVDFVAQQIGVKNLNPNLAIIFTPGRQAVIGLVESSVPDRVLKGMERQLRDAAKGQFTGSRPGIISAHVHALTGKQLIDLDTLSDTEPENPTGLRVMTSQFLSSQNRQHVHTVSYQARGQLALETGTGAITEQGITYFIVNPNNPHADDAKYRIYANRRPA